MADHDKKLSPLATIMYMILLCLSVIAVVPILVLSRLMNVYDYYFNYFSGESIRALVPWRPERWFVPLLPLYVLTWQFVPTGPLSVIGQISWLLLGIIMVEVHSVCLHRESWIAAFEPQWIPKNAQPLGGKPHRPADRRLHYILLTHTINAVPLIVIGVLIPAGWTWSCAVTSLFLIRYFAFAGPDFEGCIHWNMHCQILTLEGKPRLSKLWEVVMDYIIGPLNGYVPRVYNTNHLLVHHVRNSNPMDIHSPTPFRRSSFLEFCFFAMKLSGSIMFATDLAFHKSCRGKAQLSLFIHLFLFWALVVLLFAYGSTLAPLLVIFALHHGVSMARFQYVWHGLIHPTDSYRRITSTILWISSQKFWLNLLNGISLTSNGEYSSPSSEVDEIPTPGTDWAFYDNYHLLHHFKPRAHFTEYRHLIAHHARDFVEAKSVVLTLESMPTFAFDCWTGNVTRIASGLQTGEEMSDEEKREFIRARLEPTPEHRHPIAAICESTNARSVDRALLKMVGILTGGK